MQGTYLIVGEAVHRKGGGRISTLPPILERWGECPHEPLSGPGFKNQDSCGISVPGSTESRPTRFRGGQRQEAPGWGKESSVEVRVEGEAMLGAM